MSASFAVQRALFAALADIGCPVFDGVPVEASLPYVTLGPDVVADWSHKTGPGREHRVTLSVWDDGPGTAALKVRLAAVEAAVLGVTGSRDGHRIASVLFVRSFVARDPEGPSRGIVEFRIRTEAV